ncbi:MAG: PqqD family peptide modification chaperone [Candidatus Methanoperedens sp.]|nr:PqqD family peptide modification chaperone [Candidatus Methanoperedens sp.]MCE8424290.1 PqqD family peptide modification chaperone [Candidatus Methanoperedens sp.]MCE8426840.1 PqqD family peptide modification chaperone [Candidatus Methanoperedens sp.]
MLTKLLFPPQWIPTQPYLSLPSLTAFLKANNCDVEQNDINVSFYDTLLSKAGLSAFYEKACSRFQELESKEVLNLEFQKQYASLGASMLFGKYVINEIEGARKVLKNKESFYEIDELFRAFKIMELGLKLASSAYYPSNLTFHSYDMRYSCRGSNAVLAAIDDHEENIFLDYFEKKTVPDVLKGKPGLVGISIINTSQLIPGLTLANLIKKADPNIHINIGGSVFTRLITEISCNKELFSVFDSMIVHEGETALLSLIRHLNKELDIKDIPNLIYKEGNEIKVNKLSAIGEDINRLPTPDFGGFALDKYLSPELVLPVLSSRGCYWGRCTFCDHSFGYSGKYRPRNVDLLYKDLELLKNKYHTNFFTFQDEGVAPKLISDLSDKIIEKDLDIAWLADSRFEPAFSKELGRKLADAGCKMIYFGLESSNERILACMDKGIRKENVLKICQYSIDAGIWTHLFLIFGFPTETRDEAKETMDFILENNNIIRSMSFGSFQLTKHSIVYENPENFKIMKTDQKDSIDLSLWYEYEVKCGMTRRETDEFIQEFYNQLSLKYRDLPIWSNLDREHLFLYISHFKKANSRTTDLSGLIDRAIMKRQNDLQEGAVKKHDLYPVLSEGVFAGTFNFNLAQLIHSMMSGDALKEGLQKEKANVVFDTNNNRIFTVSDFARDILESSNGRLKISEIIVRIQEKYQMQIDEAESKCHIFLNSLMEKNMISNGKKR